MLGWGEGLDVGGIFAFFLTVTVVFKVSNYKGGRCVIFPFSTSSIIGVRACCSGSRTSAGRGALARRTSVSCLCAFFSRLPIGSTGSSSAGSNDAVGFIFSLSSKAGCRLICVNVTAGGKCLRSRASSFCCFASSSVVNI